MMAAAHCNGAPSSGEADVAAYTAACQSVSGSKGTCLGLPQLFVFSNDAEPPFSWASLLDS